MIGARLSITDGAQGGTVVACSLACTEDIETAGNEP
jgi:hypothetical protein